MRPVLAALLLAIALPAGAQPAAPPAPGAASVSAPISRVGYEVAFDRTRALTRTMQVAMTFDVGGEGPVLLSLPAWTPGAYEVSNFARWVLNFSASAGQSAVRWDKLDYDTWRLQPGGARSLTVRFDYVADTLDNAMAWARPDFALFNGTNLFMYPEGRGLDFAAQVTIRTEPEWRVATGMPRSTTAGAPNTYAASNFHDLVDMPFFVGRFDGDSAQIAGRWTRLATYPAGSVGGAYRQTVWDPLRRVI